MSKKNTPSLKAAIGVTAGLVLHNTKRKSSKHDRVSTRFLIALFELNYVVAPGARQGYWLLIRPSLG